MFIKVGIDGRLQHGVAGFKVHVGRVVVFYTVPPSSGAHHPAMTRKHNTPLTSDFQSFLDL
jgi:hypothetical protein